MNAEPSISILCSLLTGGMLLFFIESNHLEASVARRYNAFMQPFYHKLTCYLTFVTWYHSFMIWDKEKEKESESVRNYKQAIDEMSRKGGQVIVSGGEYRQMKSKEITSLCENINNIWYISGKNSLIFEAISMDRFREFELKEINYSIQEMHLKGDVPLNKYAISNVSGSFYTDVYQKVENVIGEYEWWDEQKEGSKRVMMLSIGLTVIGLTLVYFLRESISPCMVNLLTFVPIVLFSYSLYLLIQLSGKCNALTF